MVRRLGCTAPEMQVQCSLTCAWVTTRPLGSTILEASPCQLHRPVPDPASSLQDRRSPPNRGSCTQSCRTWTRTAQQGTFRACHRHRNAQEGNGLDLFPLWYWHCQRPSRTSRSQGSLEIPSRLFPPGRTCPQCRAERRLQPCRLGTYDQLGRTRGKLAKSPLASPIAQPCTASHR